jgi:Ion channel
MGLYVALGGILFNSWEGWDMVSASYFSFVTLATIGKKMLEYC